MDDTTYTAEAVGMIQHPDRGLIEAVASAEGCLSEEPSPTSGGGREVDEWYAMIVDASDGAQLWRGRSGKRQSVPVWADDILRAMWARQVDDAR